MKAGSKQSQAEKHWNDIHRVLHDNVVKDVIVLRKVFGFGEERIKRFLDAMEDEAVFFDEMSADGVLELKTESERRMYSKQMAEVVRQMAVQILPPNIYDMLYTDYVYPTRSDSAIYHKNKEREATKIDKETAEKLQAMMDDMRRRMQ